MKKKRFFQIDVFKKLGAAIKSFWKRNRDDDPFDHPFAIF